jgi:hypothetical protein
LNAAAVAKILNIKAADIKSINSYTRSTYHIQLTAGGVTIHDSKLIQKTLKKIATPDYGLHDCPVPAGSRIG